MNRTLTADDIAALRLADSITFHHGPEDARYVATCIRAHLRGGSGDNPRVWTAREQRVFPAPEHGTDRCRTVIPALSTVSSYARMAGPDAQAFHMLHFSTAEWRTIVSLMRPGDALHVTWTADNNCEAITRVGFQQDELRLAIVRGKRTMSFLITQSVGPDNSARMIRPGRTATEVTP